MIPRTGFELDEQSQFCLMPMKWDAQASIAFRFSCARGTEWIRSIARARAGVFIPKHIALRTIAALYAEAYPESLA